MSRAGMMRWGRPTRVFEQIWPEATVVGSLRSTSPFSLRPNSSTLNVGDGKHDGSRSLKGCHSTAQGETLGQRRNKRGMHPEGVQVVGSGGKECDPFRVEERGAARVVPAFHAGLMNATLSGSGANDEDGDANTACMVGPQARPHDTGALARGARREKGEACEFKLCRELYRELCRSVLLARCRRQSSYEKASQ